MNHVLYDNNRLIPLKDRDAVLEKLWQEFEDVPMDPDTEKMEGEFLHFPVGTQREEIWHWFDERHTKGVSYLLYGDGVDRTDDVAKVLYCKALCTECMSETCIFNPEGICMAPFITGHAPHLSEDGCEDFVLKEDASTCEPTRPSMKARIFAYLHELGGYADHNEKVKNVAKEFNLSEEAAENYVFDYINNIGR